MNPIGGMNFAMSQPSPPHRQIGQQLESMAASGEISSADQEALREAVKDIKSELKASRPEIRTPPPSREAMSEKIDSLISDQVESGDLTEEQGEKLTELFDALQANAPSGGRGGPKGPGGPGGRGGAGGPQSAEGASQEMLSQFLQQLQEESSSSYGQNGNTIADGSVLFDFSA